MQNQNFFRNIILRISFLSGVFSCIFTGVLTAQPQGTPIDGIVAVIGKSIVLKSELETQILQASMENTGNDKTLSCEVLEDLILQKILLTQAEYDSLEVNDSDVDSELDRRMRYFISQIGSREALEKYYNKSISDIKDEFRPMIKEQMLIQKMQQDITGEVKVTPSEVRKYFNSLPSEEIPDIETEYELYQMIFEPTVSKEQQEEVHRKITELRDRVIKGDNFSALAVLYSEDPGSAKKGGELGFFERGDMYPEFEAASFKLQSPGEISPVIQTKAGYHIIQLIERRGELINVRHILLQVKPSVYDMGITKAKADSVYALIESGKIQFSDAVVKFGDKDMTFSKAKMINQHTMSNVFSASHLDGSALPALEKVKTGECTHPVSFKTTDGDDAYRIIFVSRKTPPHKANISTDYTILQELALENKKLDTMKQWINEKKKFIFIKISDNYKNCPFTYNWNYN